MVAVFLAWLRRTWRSHVATLALLAVVPVGVQLWQARHITTGPVADFQIRLLAADGSTRVTTFATWRAAQPGATTAIYFWATWCPVCKAMAGEVTAVAAHHPVLTVAMHSGHAAQVQQYLRQRGLPWQVAIDEKGELAQALGVRAVPTFMVVGPDGTLRAPTVGYTTAPGMRLRLWWGGLLGGNGGG